MELKTIANEIPDYLNYHTIDEQYVATRQLAADYPELVSVQTLGETRHGDRIEMFTVGEANDHNALVFAGAHPCEPIGCMSIDFLARHLCEHKELRAALGYQWHFIRCIDMDGMRLNEGWFKGPFTPLHYYRNMFRPLMNEQPEMLFPVEYKKFKFDQPMPETLALKKAIDTLQPRVMLSLHNAEFGGAYYYISERLESAFSSYVEIPGWFDVPMDYGESDQVGYLERYAPAINAGFTIRTGYERRLAAGVADPQHGITWGDSSNGYAEMHYGTITLLPEVPFWTEKRINDNTPTAYTRRQVFSEITDRMEVMFDSLKQAYDRIDAHLTLDTAPRRAVQDRIIYYRASIPGQRHWIETDETLARPATVAERLKVKYGRELEWLRMRGMFLRMLDLEVSAGNDHSSFFLPREIIKNNLHDVATAVEQEIELIQLPIRSIVGVQVCTGLATAIAARELNR